MGARALVITKAPAMHTSTPRRPTIPRVPGADTVSTQPDKDQALNWSTDCLSIDEKSSCKYNVPTRAKDVSMYHLLTRRRVTLITEKNEQGDVFVRFLTVFTMFFQLF